MTPNDLHVFVATFNRPELMARQLDSLLCQTVRPEIITVLDNGTNPLSRQVVEARAAKGARYVNTHRLGNRGNGIMIKQLCGKHGYVALFHDDDMISPYYFEYVLKVVNAHPGVAVVVGKNVVQSIGELSFSSGVPHGNGLLLNGRDWAMLMFNCGTGKYPFCFYRADLYDALDIFGIFDTFGGAGDIALLLCIVGLNGQAAFLTYPFCSYGVHSGQGSGNPQTLPKASCMVRLVDEFHRFMGDDLLTLAGFSYVFKCRRTLHSNYKRRCRKDMPYAKYLAFAREIGALPRKAWMFFGFSNHLTQRYLDRFVAKRLYSREKSLIDGCWQQ